MSSFTPPSSHRWRPSLSVTCVLVKWLIIGGKETGLLMDLGEVKKQPWTDRVDSVQMINMQAAHAALLQQ